MNPESTSTNAFPELSRRKFVRAGAIGAAALTWNKRSAQAAGPSDAVNIALIGCGAQGDALTVALQKSTEVPLKWIASCDVLLGKARSHAAKVGSSNFYNKPEDMLAKHPEIDAVFIAAPDWQHQSLTTLCLKAGKQVYCEKMMSHSLDEAALMVKHQRETGNLLQIGHQRRSNPRYRFVKDNILNPNGLNVTGRMTHVYGQWNRGVTKPISARLTADEEKLIKELGYKDVFEFKNWRWLKKYGGGALSDLGAHQIDIFNWMLGTTPKRAICSGGVDFYNNVKLTGYPDPVTFEHPDNGIIVYEYDVPGHGTVRALYQVITTNSSMQAYEKYMGTNGTVVLGEVDSFNQVYREKYDEDVAKWEGQFFGKGYLKKAAGDIKHKIWERPKPWYKPPQWLDKEGVVDVRASTPLDPYELPVTMNKPYHTPHVENFLSVVRNRGKQADLNCPVEEAYKCAVAVIKVNTLISSGGGSIEFKPEDFIVS
jgi:predicted dehydrogenase